MHLKLIGTCLAGLLLAACQTTYQDQAGTILNILGDGMADIEVLTPPLRQFTRPDDAHCEEYRLRQFGPRDRIRYGTATVCRYELKPWFLAARSFGPWQHAILTPHIAPPLPGAPSAPGVPGQPSSPSAPGQWTPVIR